MDSNSISELNIDYRCLDPESVNTSAIAVAFFGMSRNLPLLYPSIKKRVFDVLDRAQISYDIFWYTVVSADPVLHLRRVEYTKNTNGADWSNPFDVALVPVCRFSVMNQEMLRYRELNEYLKVRHAVKSDSTYDFWNDTYNSVQNVLVAYHTQEEVYDMIRAHEEVSGIRYKGILAIRPDTAMMKDIDLPEKLIPYVDSLNERKLATDRTYWLPDFQHFRGYNDRAAFGSMSAMGLYLTRGIYYRDSEFKGSGEEFLKQFSIQNNMIVKMSDMRMLRVRSNGAIAYHDLFQMTMNVTRDDVDFHRCVDLETYMFKPDC